LVWECGKRFDEAESLYWVLYNDGDSEDMNEAEVREAVHDYKVYVQQQVAEPETAAVESELDVVWINEIVKATQLCTFKWKHKKFQNQWQLLSSDMLCLLYEITRNQLFCQYYYRVRPTTAVTAAVATAATK
jgi:hypothetical protein